MKNAVIISYWSGRESGSLLKLLGQIRSIEAGAPFEATIVCNGDSANLKADLLTADLAAVPVLERLNIGFNPGAWEYGWRNFPQYDNFLFLQDDCWILRKGWLSSFIKKFYSDSQIGLLGESINWQTTWKELEKSDYNNFHRDHTLDGVEMRRVDLYRAFLRQNSIAQGDLADHLQSLILFTSSNILAHIPHFILSTQRLVKRSCARYIKNR